MESNSQQYSIDDLKQTVNTLSSALLMLRTFYKDETLVNSAEFLYGLAGTVINQGLNEQILENLVFQISAIKQVVTKQIPNEVATGLRTNVQTCVQKLDYAINEFENSWLTHIGWKQDISYEVNNGQQKLDERLENATSEFNQSAKVYEETVAKIDAKFAASIKNLNSDYVFKNTTDLFKNVLGIFDGASIPSNQAEAALESVQLVGKIAEQAQKIKDDLNNNLNSLESKTAASHKQREAELKKAREIFNKVSTTYNEEVLNIASSKGCLDYLKKLDQNNLKYANIPDALKIFLQSPMEVVMQLGQIAQVEKNTEFIAQLKEYVNPLSISNEQQEFDLIKASFLTLKNIPTLSSLTMPVSYENIML